MLPLQWVDEAKTAVDRPQTRWGHSAYFLKGSTRI